VTAGARARHDSLAVLDAEGEERARGLEERLRILSEALRAFSDATTDYDRLLEVIARRLGEIVKDGCVVRLLTNDGWLRPAAIHLPIEARVPDEGMRQQIRAHVGAPRHLTEHEAARPVIEAGRALLVAKMDPRQVAGEASPKIVQVFETIGIHSLLMVALRVRGESIGLLSLFRFESQEPFNLQDQALAQALADHAALAINNSRLLQTARRELAERQRAEAALRSTEQELRYTLDSIGDGVIATDAGGKVTRMNPIAEALTGWPLREAAGRPLADVFRICKEDTGQFLPNPVERVLRDGGSAVLTNHHAMVARDGSTRPVADCAAPIRDHEGHTLGLVLVFRDMTAERNAQAERLHAVELGAENRRVHEASRLKSVFFANMSHELRTPLNAIIGFTELLSDETGGPITQRQREYLGNVLVSGRHLLQLISDVLDLSKVEAGKLTFHPEPTDPRALLGEVAATLRPTVTTRGVQLWTDVDPGMTEILIDPSRTKQVLYNFLSNAIKFTAPGGRVDARIVADGPERFRIEVADTGIGIAPQDLPRLFVEFEQLDDGTGEKHAGTGLGLALTRRLVEAQGGEVGVTSALGEGSVFFATLPRTATGPAVPAPPPSSRSSSA
jgi:PAS domain S-box-containing protein